MYGEVEKIYLASGGIVSSNTGARREEKMGYVGSNMEDPFGCQGYW